MEFRVMKLVMVKKIRKIDYYMLQMVFLRLGAYMILRRLTK